MEYSELNHLIAILTNYNNVYSNMVSSTNEIKKIYDGLTNYLQNLIRNPEMINSNFLENISKYFFPLGLAVLDKHEFIKLFEKYDYNKKIDIYNFDVRVENDIDKIIYVCVSLGVIEPPKDLDDYKSLKSNYKHLFNDSENIDINNLESLEDCFNRLGIKLIDKNNMLIKLGSYYMLQTSELRGEVQECFSSILDFVLNKEKIFLDQIEKYKRMHDTFQKAIIGINGLIEQKEPISDFKIISNIYSFLINFIEYEEISPEEEIMIKIQLQELNSKAMQKKIIDQISDNIILSKDVSSLKIMNLTSNSSNISMGNHQISFDIKNFSPEDQQIIEKAYSIVKNYEIDFSKEQNENAIISYEIINDSSKDGKFVFMDENDMMLVTYYIYRKLCELVDNSKSNSVILDQISDAINKRENLQKTMAAEKLKIQQSIDERYPTFTSDLEEALVDYESIKNRILYQQSSIDEIKSIVGTYYLDYEELNDIKKRSLIKGELQKANIKNNITDVISFLILDEINSLCVSYGKCKRFEEKEIYIKKMLILLEKYNIHLDFSENHSQTSGGRNYEGEKNGVIVLADGENNYFGIDRISDIKSETSTADINSLLDVFSELVYQERDILRNCSPVKGRLSSINASRRRKSFIRVVFVNLINLVDDDLKKYFPRKKHYNLVITFGKKYGSFEIYDHANGKAVADALDNFKIKLNQVLSEICLSCETEEEKTQKCQEFLDRYEQDNMKDFLEAFRNADPKFANNSHRIEEMLNGKK